MVTACDPTSSTRLRAASSSAVRRAPAGSRSSVGTSMPDDPTTAGCTLSPTCGGVASAVTHCHRDRANVPRGSTMSYTGGRPTLDADSHLMELPGFLDPFIEAPMLERLR